jgi:hypothetical protein
MTDVLQVFRNAISRFALYSLPLAAAHVHCARPLPARNGKFEFPFNRYKLLIIN